MKQRISNIVLSLATILTVAGLVLLFLNKTAPYYLTYYSGVILFVGHSLYEWRRNRNPMFGWLAILLSLSIIKLLWRMADLYILHLSPASFILSSWLRSTLGLFIGSGIFFILYIYHDRKVTYIKNNGSFAEYSFFSDQRLPIEIQLNKGFRNYPEKSKYPYYHILHLEIVNKGRGGLPKGRREITELDRREKELLDLIKTVSDYYYVARVTMNSFRYMYLYESEGEKSEKELKKLNSLDSEDSDDVSKFYTTLIRDENWEKALQEFKRFRFD